MGSHLSTKVSTKKRGFSFKASVEQVKNLIFYNNLSTNIVLNGKNLCLRNTLRNENEFFDLKSF